MRLRGFLLVRLWRVGWIIDGFDHWIEIVMLLML
jgi:hypothetical protein